jgi:hypothetical protein
MPDDSPKQPITKKTIAIASSLFALFSAFTGFIAYFDSHYVLRTELEQEKTLRIQQQEHMDEKFLELAQTVVKSQTALGKDVKDAKAFPLIVRRDILMVLTDPTPKEQAELRVLQTKLAELNIR